MEPKFPGLPTDFDAVRTDATLTAVKESSWDAYETVFAIRFSTTGSDDILLGLKLELIEDLIMHLQQALKARQHIGGHA